jgi:hypothetical protein
MKGSYLFFVFMLIIALEALSQESVTPNLPVDPESKKILYREVVEEPGTPGYLYEKAIEWFGYYYINAQSVYSIQDKNNGKIEGIGRMKIFRTDEKSGIQMEAGLITYTIRLEFKSDKYRYTLTDFTLKAASRFPIEKWLNKSDPAYNSNWDIYLFQIDTIMQRLTSTLKEKMKPTVQKKDEW